MRITFAAIPVETSTTKITGVSKKTGRKIALSEVVFNADPDFFIELADKILDVLDTAEKVDQLKSLFEAVHTEPTKPADEPQDPIVARQFEDDLVAKLRKAVREMWGGLIATEGTVHDTMKQ